MNIVIPMAGAGTRLAGHESGRPKPLIQVEGRPLWRWATECLPLNQAERLVFICLKEHVDTFDLKRSIQKDLSSLPVQIRVLDSVTDGQLRTVVSARDLFESTCSTLIFNADTWFRHDERAFLDHCHSHAGTLGVAEQEGDRWSFARLAKDGRVVEVAEKQRISPLASTGLYHFSDTRIFLADADAALSEPSETAEHYVAPIYQRMIDRGDLIGVVRAEEFFPIGTPVELELFSSRVRTSGPTDV